MKPNALRLLIVATPLILMTSLDANVLPPGGMGSPDVFANPGDVTPLGLESGSFSFGSGMGLITGTYFETVVTDPLGITCSGCLDFAFQLTLDPGLTAGIFNSNLARFRGYMTDVGYIGGSGIAPISVQRGSFGGMIGFVFASPGTTSNVIGPGDTSAILVVATDATTYDNLGVLGINGGRAGSPAHGQITGLFEPTFQNSVPEPSPALLFGLGLLAIAISWRRINHSCRYS